MALDSVPNSTFPVFRTNLNASLAEGAKQIGALTAGHLVKVDPTGAGIEDGGSGADATSIQGFPVSSTPATEGQVLQLAPDGSPAVDKWVPTTPSGGSGNYQTVEVGGSAQTQRAKLNLIEGAGVTLTPSDNSGANSTDVTIAATGGGGGAGTDFLSENRPKGTPGSVQAKNTSVVGGATATLLSLSASGYVSGVWISLSCSDTVALTDSILTITTDGNTVFSDRLPLFFGAEYLHTTVNFRNKYIGGQQNGGTNVGMYSHIAIPFASSISITLTNGSGGTTALLFYTISYQTGTTAPAGQSRLRVSSGTISPGTLGVDTTAILVNESSLSPGRLIGVYMSVDAYPGSANPGTAGLEGRVKIYLDGAGSPQFASSGTEDYFEWSNYFEGSDKLFGNPTSSSTAFSCDQGYTGIQFSTTPGSATWNCYRFHILDPITFANALKVTWDAGYSSVVNYTGTYRLAYTVWYYTD